MKTLEVRRCLTHPERAPEVSKLIATLARYGVRYVLVGSVAVALYGAETEPGDLDVTPALDWDNLRRLKRALEHLKAKPSSATGHWTVQPNGEKRWFPDELTVEEAEAFREAWRLEPDDPSTSDHLFTTRYGNLDVVPELAGSYSELRVRAGPMQVFGHEVWVAHPDDLLGTLTIPRRDKDRTRVVQLREVQRTLYLYSQSR